VQQLIRTQGVHVYPGSVRFLHAVRGAGLRTAVCSSSANAGEVLRVTGLDALIDVRVDGVTLAELRLPGKPAPDLFLEGARRVGVAPANAAVFEDAIAGVEAGRAGHFGYVIGVDRGVGEDALRRHGADTVVHDLAELLE
jgi:HAD superfamily hydrolase (TIGR01509 family)